MHVDADDRIVVVRREARATRRRCPAARAGARQHGHLRLPARVPARPAAPRRRRPALQPRLRQGHHPVHRQATARRSRTASRDSCVRSRAEARAYWRDVGTVDAYWEANIDLTDVVPGARPLRPRLADLDLRRDHAAGEVRARRGRPARHRRSPRWSRAAASSPARRCGARCCSPACTCIPTPASRTRWSCPTSTSAARARLTQRRHRPRRADPRRGSSSARTRSSTPRASAAPSAASASSPSR